MPDYASILRRSISALPDPSPEMREVVYQRARAALARQLTAVDPPLSSREIENQHQELEDAVARLEADFAPEESEPDAAEDDQNVFYDAPAAVAPRQSYDGGYAVDERPADPADADYDDAEEDEEDDDGFDDERPARRTGLMLGLGAVAVVVLGLGAFGYAQRGSVLGLFGGDDTEQAATASATPPARTVTAEPADPVPEEPAENTDLEAGAGVPAPGAAPEKRPDRLVNGTEAPPAAEPGPADLATADPLPPPDPAVPAPGPESPPPGEALAPESQGQQTAAVNEPGGSIVAQRAIYYFQGAEGTAGQATEGSVTWAQMSRDSGPAIQATLRLGDREATTTVTIYRNTDPTLPASHLVEVNFAGGGLGPSRVQRVPALVMKQTEQARGQPLTGAAVPVTDDLFWIALSDDAEQVARNLQLLREGSWFDIPILFEDGTRALLTFEKGIPGDKVFETVMAGWTPT